MDHFQGQSFPETLNNSEHKNHFSKNENGKFCLSSYIKELEKCGTKTNEIPDHLDSSKKDAVGNMILKFCQLGFGESEKKNSQPTERNNDFSNEDTANNFRFDTNSYHLQHRNSLGIWPASSLSAPQYISDDKEGLSDSSKRQSISRSKNNDNDSNIIKPNSHGYNDFTSTLHEQIEVQNCNSIIANSHEEYKTASEASNKNAFSDIIVYPGMDCTRDYVGKLNLEPQHYGFPPYEQQGISIRNEKFKIINTRKETTAPNLAFDSHFNLQQQGIPLRILSSNYPLSVQKHISENKDARISKSLKKSIISGSKGNANEFNAAKLNIRDNIKAFASTFQAQVEVQSSTSKKANSKEKYREASNLRNRDEVYYNVPSLHKSLEFSGKGVICHRNIPMTTESAGNNTILREQRDNNVQDFNEGPHNQISSGIASQVSENRGSEFYDNREFLVPVNIGNTVVIPSRVAAKRHINDRPSNSKECNSLKSHVFTHNQSHTEVKTFPCEKCGKRFSSSSNRAKHCRIHTGEKRFACDKCVKRFRTSSHLVRHTSIHTGEKPFQCDICWKRFSRTDVLAIHRRIHTRELSCEVCGKGFSHAFKLAAHCRVHTREKPFACDNCTKRFCNSSNLARHRRIHTGEKPSVCNVCGKRFRQPNDLAKHRRIHTRVMT